MIILNTHLFKLDCETSSQNLNKSLSSPLPGTKQYWWHEESWSLPYVGLTPQHLV